MTNAPTWTKDPKIMRWLSYMATSWVALNYIFMPKRKKKRPQHDYDWHHCFVRGCFELIRPLHVMCNVHWCKLPVPMRFRLLELAVPGSHQSPEFTALLGRALVFARTGVLR